MKSGDSQVNSCTVSRADVCRSVILLKSKEIARQVANGWQKLLMKQDISIILAVHKSLRPQTAHSLTDRGNFERKEVFRTSLVERVLTTQTSLPDK